MLEQTLTELEEEIAERELTAQAKAVLQGAYSMSEEQAHLHLQITSWEEPKAIRSRARQATKRQLFV